MVYKCWRMGEWEGVIYRRVCFKAESRHQDIVDGLFLSHLQCMITFVQPFSMTVYVTWCRNCIL